MRIAMLVCLLAAGVGWRGPNGGSVAGRVTDEAGHPSRPYAIYVFVVPEPNPADAEGTRADVGEDGTFRVDGLAAGRYRFEAFDSMHVPRYFEIVRVERDGRPLPDGVVEVRDGDEVANLSLIMTRATSRLEGAVRIVNGELPPGAYVTVTVRRDDPRYLAREPWVEYADGPGRAFTFAHLLAARYELLAEAFLPLDRNHPLALARVVYGVSLTAGVTTSVVTALDANHGDFGDVIFLMAKPRLRHVPMPDVLVMDDRGRERDGVETRVELDVRGAICMARWAAETATHQTIALDASKTYGFLVRPAGGGRCEILRVWLGDTEVWPAE
jgi:hypothetical protein